MATDSVIAVSPTALREPLPPIPNGFERELANVAQIKGKPLFKIVNGQTELKWRNGKMDVKHLLQSPDFPCYVPVVNEVFRRQRTGTDEYVKYPSATAAKSDTDETLGPDIDVLRMVTVRAIGRACWIVEVYVAPEEIGEGSWNAKRFEILKVMGVDQRVDVLGPFPKEGMYVYCFSVLGEDGEAIAPTAKTIEECKRRWAAIQDETATLEEDTNALEGKLEEFEKRQIAKVAENIYQYHGIAARRLHYGAVSKPILKTYGQSA